MFRQYLLGIVKSFNTVILYKAGETPIVVPATQISNYIGWSMSPVDTTVLKQYLLGKASDAVANSSLTSLAGSSSIGLQTFTSTEGRNFQRYDYLIKGWIEYFKSTENWVINGKIIKAMMLRESHMGYEDSTSPNMNVTRDVMQCLDPRNAAIYEFVNIDPVGGARIFVHNANRQYILLSSGDVDNYSGKGSTDLYDYDPVARRLFQPKYHGATWYYYYQYDISNPTLSTLLGVVYYNYQFERFPALNENVFENQIQAAVFYNNGGDSSVGDPGYGTYIESHLNNRNGDY